MLTDSVALAVKDLRIEMRSPVSIAAALVLGLTGLVVAGLAVGPDTERLRTLAPGLTWLAILYVAVSVAERLDRIDRDDDAISPLWLSARDRRAIYLGKVLALGLVLAGVALTLWLASLALLNVEGKASLVALAPLAVLAGLATAAPAALITSVIGAAPRRVLLLPVTLLPLLAPTLLAATQASASLIEGRIGEAGGWAAVLVVEACLFLGLGLLAYETGAAPE